LSPKTNEPEQNHVDDETRARRKFLMKIGKGSVAVPAAALLLAASAKQAQAAQPSGACGACGGCGCGCGG
jgi:hypothetical protein